MTSNMIARMRANWLAMLGSTALLALSQLIVATPAMADGAGPWLTDAFASPGGGGASARARRLASPAMRLGAKASIRSARPTEDGDRPAARRNGVRTASLGRDYTPQVRQPRLSGGSVRWVANSGCLNSTLRSIVHGIASRVGPVTVSSTCRSHSHNRRVGGARKSYHLTGDAVDFRVRGSAGAALAYLRSSSAGGIHHYGGGLFHVDTGPRRSW